MDELLTHTNAHFPSFPSALEETESFPRSLDYSLQQQDVHTQLSTNREEVTRLKVVNVSEESNEIFPKTEKCSESFILLMSIRRLLIFTAHHNNDPVLHRNSLTKWEKIKLFSFTEVTRFFIFNRDLLTTYFIFLKSF